MSKKNKKASKNETANTPAGGPPVKKKAPTANLEVQQQLAKLIQDSPAPAKKKKAPKNDAMEALIDGAAKKKAAKEGKGAKPDSVVKHAKEVGEALLKEKQHAFIDGPVKDVAEAFVRLYVSRATSGDAEEAWSALEACRVAFDACGFELTDVETKKTNKKVATKKEKK